MTDETLGSLSSEEQAYFSSRGETTAPEPAPAPAPEPVLDDDDAELGVEQPKEHKTVPLAALTKERQTVKEFRAKLAEMEKTNAVLADRWETLLKMNEQPQPAPKVEEDPMPDPNTDIFAFSRWQQQQLEKLQSRLDERDTTEKQQTEAQQRETAVWTFWDQSVAQYKAETPDFTDAAQFLSDARVKQLKAYAAVDPNYGDDKVITAQINNELKAIIGAAAQQRRNPAEAVYALAKEWGYTGKAPAPAVDPVAALAKTEQALEQAASLSAVGGSSPAAELTPNDIANMSSDQFEKWLNKNPAKFKKMMGG